MARTAGTIDADFVQIGVPHFFDEVAKSVTRAEHVEHRDQLYEAIVAASARRPRSTWWLAGRRDFVEDVAQAVIATGVPSRRIEKDAYLGMRRRPRPTAEQTVLQPGAAG